VDSLLWHESDLVPGHPVGGTPLPPCPRVNISLSMTYGYRYPQNIHYKWFVSKILSINDLLVYLPFKCKAPAFCRVFYLTYYFSVAG
jgi:hypothetical protein